MEQTDRIKEMERHYDRLQSAVSAVDAALAVFREAQNDAARLVVYFDSPDWRTDFEADEAGCLPQDLKRGVLSEDGLYNLLDDYHRLQTLIDSTP